MILRFYIVRSAAAVATSQQEGVKNGNQAYSKRQASDGNDSGVEACTGIWQQAGIHVYVPLPGSSA